MRRTVLTTIILRSIGAVVAVVAADGGHHHHQGDHPHHHYDSVRSGNHALLRGANNNNNNNNNGRKLEENNNDHNLNMQDHPFVLAGIRLDPDQAQENCPDEWIAFAAYVATECPNAMATCPSSVFYNNNNTSFSSSLPKTIKNPSTKEVVVVNGLDCEQIEESFCSTFGTEGCCMMNCQARIQELLSCMIQATMLVMGEGGTMYERLACSIDTCGPAATTTATTVVTITASPTNADGNNQVTNDDEEPVRIEPEASETDSGTTNQDDDGDDGEDDSIVEDDDDDDGTQALEGDRSCVKGGDRFSCVYTANLEAPINGGGGGGGGSGVTFMKAVVSCLLDDEQVGLGLDVRRAKDCKCQATLMHYDESSPWSSWGGGGGSSGPEKICDCQVCSEFSIAPISLDCRNNVNDPFVMSNDCPTLNCNAECEPVVVAEDDTTTTVAAATTTNNYYNNNNIPAEEESFTVSLMADRSTIVETWNGTDVTTDGFFSSNFVPALGKLFFQSLASSTGYELWVTNGELGGTRLVKDINPGFPPSLDETGSFKMDSAELGGNLLFFADDGVHGKELWRTDGTEKGTVLIKDIVDGEQGVSLISHPGGSMAKYDGRLYFGVSHQDQEDVLWTTNGTAKGTFPVGVHSIFPNSLRINSLLEKTEFDGKTYFVASPSNQSALYVYVSDGTVEGTQRVTEHHVLHTHADLVECNKKVYFNTGHLWMTDGTEEGTKHVLGPNGTLFASPQSMTAVDGNLYFWSDCKLWRSDGADDGFLLLLDRSGIFSCSGDLVQFGSKVLFRSGHPQQPWISDGTAEETFQLADVELVSTLPYALFDERLAFFGASSEEDGFGHNLWVTDGTRKNTAIIPNIGIDKASLHSHFDNLLVFGNAVYVTVWYLFAPGDELWKVEIPDDPVAALESLARESGTGASTGTVSTIIASNVTADAQAGPSVMPFRVATTDAPTESSSTSSTVTEGEIDESQASKLRAPNDV